MSVYHGRIRTRVGAGSTTTGMWDTATVHVLEPDGVRYLLPHDVRHSPTGFAWGYGGSGPADLARCLLIHALGEDARCVTCEGSGWMTEDADGKEVPAAVPAYGDRGTECDIMRWNCCECEAGNSVVPAVYQQFKFDVVAKLPDTWTLTGDEIREWYDNFTQQAEAIGPWPQ